ncbi:hypothetical protein DPEC_G00340320 [Dallia pectoralis]|uniref:Uncharacterized protein n=1 Tax=Dallia pectoralis TaxID=75939 RepID=A0ACC2F5A2_DALPE|nr:hypothetical protein DPEC_G00340320 [Dallia pectoralis]
MMFRECVLRHLIGNAIRRQMQNTDPAVDAAPKQAKTSLFKGLRNIFKRNNRPQQLLKEEGTLQVIQCPTVRPPVLEQHVLVAQRLYRSMGFSGASG